MVARKKKKVHPLLRKQINGKPKIINTISLVLIAVVYMLINWL